MKKEILFSRFKVCKMMKVQMLLFSFIVVVLISLAGVANAGIDVKEMDNSTVTKEDLAAKIQSGGINIDMNTVRYTGLPRASGTFYEGSLGGLDIDEGIILTTGYAIIAADSNTSERASIEHDGVPGDSDLNDLLPSGNSTLDAAVLEFEFTAQNPLLCVRYVFASEEYNEFVDRGYNDIFAFFVRKKGDADWKNIALVPGSSDTVSVDNINNFKNAELYIDNDINGPDPLPYWPYDIEYDGFTHVMCANYCDIIPGETYELKLAIADTNTIDYPDDAAFDTAVFISEITDEPQLLTILTSILPSQEVGTFFSQTIRADGSPHLDYKWSIDFDKTVVSPNLPDGILGDIKIEVDPTDSRQATLSWTLPEVPEGEFINVVLRVEDSIYESCFYEYDDEEQQQACADRYSAEATFQYTDPVAGEGFLAASDEGSGGGCFISTAAYGSLLQLDADTMKAVFLLFGFAAVPVIYRRVKRVK